MARDLEGATHRARPHMIDVRLFNDLDAVAADAGSALERGSQGSLYDRLDWFRLNLRHGVAHGRAIVARARDEDATCWLFLGGEGRRGAILGGWYTLAYAPIFAGSPDTRLIAAIARELRGRLGRITLAPLSESVRNMLVDGFRAGGWWVQSEVSSANWVAHIENADFAAYWARRPSQLRNTVRRKQRDGGLSIAVHDRFDSAAWADYEAVYAGSWKPEEGSPGFVQALAEQEGAAGTLRLGIARRGERPVAAQLWTVENGSATIHKLAYVADERAASPGTLLSEAMFRHVIERDQPRLIDFGTGDDAYKADWMDEKRPLYRVALFSRRSVIGWAGAVRSRLASRRLAA
jgi:hypothetical protein